MSRLRKTSVTPNRPALIDSRASPTLATTHPKTLASTVTGRAPIVTQTMARQGRPTCRPLRGCLGGGASYADSLFAVPG